MKKCFLMGIFLMVLLLGGCTASKDSALEKAVPSQTAEEANESNPFSGVDEIYMDVLSRYTARGYALLDLDGNGTDELLITDGEEIYELYGICDDGQLHIMLERNRYIVEMKLCSDNRIFVHETDFNGCDYYSVLAMRTQVGNLPQELFVLCDGDSWWAGPYEKDAEPTTEEEARLLLDAIEFQQIEFIPFS